MFNRTGQLRSRKARLNGQQLDIAFPRRGRPSKFRRLERAGQMRLDLQRPTANTHAACAKHTADVHPETMDSALDYLFPVGPMTDDELHAEFVRMFPL
jgi:hypothetical protein